MQKYCSPSYNLAKVKILAKMIHGFDGIVIVSIKVSIDLEPNTAVIHASC